MQVSDRIEKATREKCIARSLQSAAIILNLTKLLLMFG